MKKTIINIMVAFLFVVGCSKDVLLEDVSDDTVAIEKQEEGTTYSFVAEMPNEATTRVTLEQEGLNIKVMWLEGDQVHLCLAQGEQKVKQVATVKDISDDGRRARFEFTVPAEFGDASFDLYGVYGGGGLDDANPTIAILSTPTTEAFADGSYLMMHFKEEVVPNEQLSVTFNHLGSLFLLTLKNLTTEGIAEMNVRLSGHGGQEDWAYNSGAQSGQRYDLVANEFLNKESAGNDIYLYAQGDIAAGQMLTYMGWYPLLPNVAWPDLKLWSDAGNSGNIKESNGKIPVAGKAYHFYAVASNAGVFFTDRTFVPSLEIGDLSIEGDLMHAAGADDGIAVVYKRGDGNLYLNMARTDGTWYHPVGGLLGPGSEARIALDRAANPHVVYKTDDNRIAYVSMPDGVNFVVDFIGSGNGGACSKPDIAVDSNGKAHITYSDTRGGSSDTDNYAEIMYAENSSGTFATEVIYDGWYYYESGSGGANYFNKSSKIALDGAGQYYILTHFRNINKGMGWTDTNYYVKVKTANAEGRTAGTYKTDKEDIHDIVFDGENMVAMYKDRNVVKVVNLEVTDAVIDFTNAEEVATELRNSYTTPASLLAEPALAGTGNVARRTIGGVNSSYNIFYKHGAINSGVEEVLTDYVVKTNTVVVATKCNNSYYIVYTDNANGRIGFLKK